jgi:hypothetical protein
MFFARRRWALRVIERMGLPARNPVATELVDMIINGAKTYQVMMRATTGESFTQPEFVLMAVAAMTDNGSAFDRLRGQGFDAEHLLARARETGRQLVVENGFHVLVRRFYDRLPEVSARISASNPTPDKATQSSAESLDISAPINALSWAQKEMADDRFFEPLDAVLACQPQLAALNMFLGRPRGSFAEVTFDEVIDRVAFLQERNMFQHLLTAISSSVPMASDAVILAAAFSIEIDRIYNSSDTARRGAREELRARAVELLRRLNQFTS